MRSHIQYTLLKPEVTDNQIDAAAQLAVQTQIAALCVPPYWVKKASRETSGTLVQLITVVGYPLGYQRTEAKIAEMELAFTDGAVAIELVINLSAFKSRRMNWIKAEIARFSQLVHIRETTLTVITDGLTLTEEETDLFCKTAADAGADYICLSPEFSPVSASPARIEKWRSQIPQPVGLKTWLGEARFRQAEEFIQAGAEILCVPSLALLKENTKIA